MLKKIIAARLRIIVTAVGIKGYLFTITKFSTNASLKFTCAEFEFVFFLSFPLALVMKGSLSKNILI